MLHRQIELLCITCRRDDISYDEQVRLACEGGADMIQFRDKEMNDKELFETAVKLNEICKKYNVCFAVNNRIDIADISEADGVHLGQSDLPVYYARKILGHEKIVGISASGIEKALAAEKLPVDYIGCGAIFPTETKKDAIVRGLEVLKELKKKNLVKPIIAIGGINKNNVAEVIKAGADGVAVVSSVCGSGDIKEEAEIIKNIIKNTKGK